MIVPAVTTRLEADSTAAALIQRWPDVDRETAASLCALIWVETGRGQSCKNWNVGNLSASETWATSPNNKAWRPPWFEVTPESSERLRRLHEAMLAGRAPRAFRAYDSVVEGMAAFLSLLRSPPYTNVLEAARTGETLPFIKALSTRYSADYTDAHIPAFADSRAIFVPLVAGQPAPTPSLFGGGLAAGGSGMLLVYLAAKALLG